MPTFLWGRAPSCPNCHPGPGQKMLEALRKAGSHQDRVPLNPASPSHAASAVAVGYSTLCRTDSQAPAFGKELCLSQRDICETIQPPKVTETSGEFCLKNFCSIQPLLPQGEIHPECMTQSDPKAGLLPLGFHVLLLLRKMWWAWGEKICFSLLVCNMSLFLYQRLCAMAAISSRCSPGAKVELTSTTDVILP